MRPRIQTLDGLRFIAAIGVVWIHAWTFHGNARFHIGHIDIADFMALGGNGVDLFFVISGFCMYFFYASKSDFSYHDFYRFLVKRWVRLSPAFYAATVVYLLWNAYVWGHFYTSDIWILPNSIFYLNSIFPQYNSGAHFWTLGVEWQFYIVIPFLLIYQNRIGFKSAFISIFGSLWLLAAISVLIFKSHLDILTDQVLFRGVEFSFGIVAARLLLKNQSFFRFRALWVIAFIIITYLGRVLISKPVLNLSSNYYNLFKLCGFSLLGLGFAGILYMSLTSAGKLKAVLGNRLFKNMGKISYSFYLWHGLVLWFVAGYTNRYMPFAKGLMAPIITTCITTIILYPVSLLSYNLLEKPFLSTGNLTTK